ncbi:AcrR family transcriptional regulator [Catenulispora sp. GAS73]
MPTEPAVPLEPSVTPVTPAQPEPRSKRSDAARNERTLLAAAAEVFVASGVDAPIRQIAAKAGVGVGTFYRHFPTRADLITAVYRHQIEECAAAGPTLLAEADSPFEALRRWIDMFTDFLVTKHGLADALRSDAGTFTTLHTYFLDRLGPVAASLVEAAVAAGEIRSDISAYELMRGVGNLCVGRDLDPRYEPRRLIAVLLNGLRTPV